ncbi:MAG TPA: ATP-binding cassette domain-containing protein [Solirubrobacteraceae bacterium]|nr:ATP-binding cassette domain-containing protein [Solirubrobacteraceae bacterium]
MGSSLELHAIRRSFGDVVAVDGLSFSVAAGALFGFVGRNGAGKTTTMRIICGLLATDDGEVSWGGAPIDAAMRARIGYMPEEHGLYPKMRLRDQLEYFAVLHGAPHPPARAAARDWLDRLGLADRERARVDELSQGNQQRVQLAAALVHRPDLLVLDEPFAGLDPIVTDLLAGVLREEAARGVPVLFSSHQLDLVEHLCESVAVIDHGRLIACGRVDELRSGGPRLVRVDVRNAAAGWADALDGVDLVERAGPRTVFKLAPSADPECILDAARPVLGSRPLATSRSLAHRKRGWRTTVKTRTHARPTRPGSTQMAVIVRNVNATPRAAAGGL